MQGGSVVLDTDEGQVSIPLDQLRRCTIKPSFAKGEKKTFSKAPKGGKAK